MSLLTKCLKCKGMRVPLLPANIQNSHLLSEIRNSQPVLKWYSTSSKKPIVTETIGNGNTADESSTETKKGAKNKKRSDNWVLPDLNNKSRRNTKFNRGNSMNKMDKDDGKEQNLSYIKTLPPDNWRKDKSLPQYMRQKYALKEKKLSIDLSKKRKLSRSAIEGIREIYKSRKEDLSTDILAEFFSVSPIVISKILKSKWQPSETELIRKNEVWLRRGEKLLKQKTIENNIQEYIDYKERQLNIELPEFFKEKLNNIFKLNNIRDTELDNYFNELVKSRFNKEKFDENMIKYENIDN
ncbi:unnamed protein product [[Candida] boidinii]|uniref:Required for respiratory growth protein 9, mitochondrial n=1 Tax=Candida boidinii TaxID=5477 RepID=A0A9W6WGH5_CANBO|nr:hypothetical protein B5S30_g2546 [[Candida] boidinii]GME68312.1 unnamed protein product [[Candida] boidinii]GMG10813.1 unnamed protein product [[Candida] boidinii]